MINKWAGIFLISIFISSCANYEPFEMQSIDSIPDGPGLISGEDGEFKILGNKKKTTDD